MKLASALFALALATLAPSLRAAATPEEVTLKQIYATKSANWNEFTAIMHPKAVAKFKELMIPVAEAATAANSDAGKKILDRVFANQPIDKLKTIEPAEFFKHFMQNWAAKTPGFIEAMKGANIQMLGAVKEGDTLAHVVYRMTLDAGGSKVTRLEVVSLEKDGEEWKSSLSSELENLAASLMRQLNTK